jgi:multisubunit Na+/H+ antiporter MnhG subunit
MNFDLRLPIGLMFSFFGLLLTALGIFSGPEIYDRSLGININLDWGLFMLGFGLIMLAFVWRHRSVRTNGND